MSNAKKNMTLNLKNCFFFVFLFSLNFLFAQSSITTLNPETEQKVSDLISEMSIEEKVGQTCQITLDAILVRDANGAVVRPIKMDTGKLKEALIDYKIGSILNVESHTLSMEQWELVINDVLAPYRSGETKAPIIYGVDAIHGVNYTIGATLFPQEIGLAATWNTGLACDFGNATAYETRASGIPWNFSPVLDIARQPLWSRYFETLGEDPHLAAELGKAIVCGYQGGEQTDSYHTAACLKHFVGYSAPFSGRDRTPAWIPEKYMQELFLYPFEAAIRSGAMTVMVNSGDVNGQPGHTNYHLLTEVLKDDWGFNGFAVSDWEDFIMLETVHRVAKSPKEAIIQAFNAGVDMSMVPYNPQYKTYCKLMVEAVNEGSISMERLDDAVRRILRVKMAVGLFEKNENQANNYKEFGSDKYKKLALNAALESITLLKNESGILPLKGSEKVLISGPTANDLTYLNGAWTHTWQGLETKYNTQGCKTIYQAMQDEFGKENCLYTAGAELYMEDGFEQCKLKDKADFKSKAAQSDVILLCLGELPSTEKPGDIRSLNMPKAQMDLAKMAYETGKPVIIVLVEARPRIIHNIVDEASAIFQAYLPGDYGGVALTKLLCGKENPSGKLPYSYPKFDGVIEFYDHPRSVDRAKSNDFKAYNPEWDFGHGLSYTSFSYSNLSISQSSFQPKDSIVIKVTVTNSGSRSGKEVVQLYVSDKVASLVPAGKRLKGFEKIELDPLESKEVTFKLTIKDLSFATNSGEWIYESGDFEVNIGGLKSTFELKN